MTELERILGHSIGDPCRSRQYSQERQGGSVLNPQAMNPPVSMHTGKPALDTLTSDKSPTQHFNMSTKHTPTPWHNQSDWKSIYSEDGCFIATVVKMPTYKNKIEHSADSDRIVSCVNACAGLNPEAIPGAVKALEDFINDCDNASPEFWARRISDRRDQALAALKEVKG